MPIYEYVCSECNKIFEVSGTFEALVHFKPQCPDCMSKNVKKKISSVFFILKGKGFYKTDSNGASE